MVFLKLYYYSTDYWLHPHYMRGLKIVENLPGSVYQYDACISQNCRRHRLLCNLSLLCRFLRKPPEMCYN
jgi:hypothetical protein